jgi:hypothetical protein
MLNVFVATCKRFMNVGEEINQRRSHAFASILANPTAHNRRNHRGDRFWQSSTSSGVVRGNLPDGFSASSILPTARTAALLLQGFEGWARRPTRSSGPV